MFLRFVCARRDPCTRVETGLFGPAIDVKNGISDAPEWIREEITRELDWFNANLPIPRKLYRASGRHGRVAGVCWFRPEASDAISRARYVAWLLTEAGVPTRGIRSRTPGEIIWHDPMQVVARPSRNHPHAFRRSR